MKAFALGGGFGFDHLGYLDIADPVPGPGQVLVRVRAASLNYRDLLILKGQYNPKLKLPRILGSDAAGEVIEIGPGVTRYKPGDRVVGCFMQAWPDGPISDTAARSALGADRDGVLAELVVLEEGGILPIPSGLSYVEAAALPCAAVTAWNALQTAGVGPSKTVLLLGTGGVSIFALQFAKALNARVLIASGHEEKLARALQLGADAGTNYRTHPDWDRWAREQTGGVGVDHVVEVGGAGTLEKSAKAVRLGGHISLIGVLAGAGTFNPIHILMKAISVQGIFVGSRAMFEAMNRLIVEQRIQPVIDRIFPFAEALVAFRHLDSGTHFGKVVIEVE